MALQLRADARGYGIRITEFHQVITFQYVQGIFNFVIEVFRERRRPGKLVCLVFKISVFCVG